jgi:hypothetical protein
MSTRSCGLFFLLVSLVSLGTTGKAVAARVRFHYVPVPVHGAMVLQPAAASGERLVGSRKGCPEHYPYPEATCPLLFTNPCTGAQVQVPVVLPEGTPRIEHVWNRIVFNYGSYTIEVRFFPDGSVDVIYNSGLLRAL